MNVTKTMEEDVQKLIDISSPIRIPLLKENPTKIEEAEWIEDKK